jgi:hypothetical protein
MPVMMPMVVQDKVLAQYTRRPRSTSAMPKAITP